MINQRSHGMTGNRIAGSNILLTFLTVFLVISLAACGQSIEPPAPTATPASTPTPAPTLQAGDSQHTIKVDNLDRTYLLHIPPGLESGKPSPVVIALHGFDNEHFFEVTDLQNMTGFGDISDKNGFILVYPSGDSGFWNVGGGCCGSSADKDVNEADFMRQIIKDIGAVATVDPKRIYATGFSMGGMLAFRLACEMSDTFAAVAPVAGSLLYGPCQPAQPVSIMQVHGKADTSVPYTGGLGGFMTGTFKFPPVDSTIAAWAQLDSCSSSATTDQQGVAVHTAFPGCKAGSSVELYTIDVLGHNWPSQYVIPVSQMIWDFFKAHPKP